MSLETPGEGPVSELVWDVASRGTAFSQAGTPLPVSLSNGWSPELLLATSVAASIMVQFLELAADAGLEVLGYVSRQRLSTSKGPDVPTIEIFPSIVVASDDAARVARNLFAQAETSAHVVRMLQQPPEVEVQVTVVRDRRDAVPRWDKS